MASDFQNFVQRASWIHGALLDGVRIDGPGMERTTAVGEDGLVRLWDFSVGLDRSGSFRQVQRADRLADVVLGKADVHHHYNFRTIAERVAENLGELAVSAQVKGGKEKIQIYMN